MEAGSELTIRYTAVGRNGKLLLTAYLGDTPLHTDRLDIADAQARRRFVRQLCEGRDGIDDEAVAEELERIAASTAEEKETPNTAASPADSSPYRATDRGLVWLKPTRDGDVPTPLTNFAAQIVADLSQDDGVEIRRSFEIEAKLAGRLSRFSVPAPRFAGLTWAFEHLGAQAMIYPGFAVKDHARAAIQMLSDNVAARTIYTHTGWREIGDGWAYLHADGSIGPDGPVPGIEVRLPDGLKLYALPGPPEAEGLVAAIRASLRILRLAPEAVVWPLFCTPWRSVLGPCAFAVHLAGHTGTGKSELAALVQQHFGAGMSAKHLPASWSSTANALEGLAFSAKDVVMTIDDFAPAGSQYDVQRFHREADRIFHAQGNRSSRQRMMPDATLRPPKPPRGMILSTGEDVPRGQSVRARMMIVEMGLKDMDWDVLTACQRDAAAGLYAQAMAGFIRWLAPQREGFGELLRRQVAELRERATQSDQHKRTPEILAELAVGLRYFLTFAEAAGEITAGEGEALWDRGWAALGEVAEAQAGHHTANDPVQRFIELLASALVSGHAHIAGTDGGEPDTPEAWGWRLKTIGTGPNVRDEWQPQGDRIGWVDGDDLYLDPGASYRVVQQMAVAGDGIAVTSRTLHKRLQERGLLASREAQRKKLTVRRMLDGVRRAVLHLHEETLLGEEPAQPAQRAQNSSRIPQNAGSGADSRAAPADGEGKQAHENGPHSTEKASHGPFGPFGPLVERNDSNTSDDARDELEERAAIIEFEGNVPREEAKALAQTLHPAKAQVVSASEKTKGKSSDAA